MDTYALIEIAEGNPKYHHLLNSDAVTLKDNLAELYYFFLKKYDQKTADLFLEEFRGLVVDLPIELIPKSMLFKHSRSKSNFSYADCMGYVFALESKRVFITGDRAFKGLDNVEIIR